MIEEIILAHGAHIRADAFSDLAAKLCQSRPRMDAEMLNGFLRSDLSKLGLRQLTFSAGTASFRGGLATLTNIPHGLLVNYDSVMTDLSLSSKHNHHFVPQPKSAVIL